MIRINQIKITPEASLDKEALDKELTRKIKRALRLKPEASFTYRIIKKSVDSRKKPDIFIVYSVDVMVKNFDIKKEEALIKLVHDNNIMLSKTVSYQHPEIKRTSKCPPVIVGFGPAGMFAALFLARAGFAPIVVERGEAVEKRLETVNGFWSGTPLNTSSNAQFGEGGAGTFSDGKLNTQVKEVYGRITKVLETFVEHGADDDILYEAKPHIGSDRLINIVKNIRKEILDLGGSIHFETQMTDVHIEKNKITGIQVRQGNTGEVYDIPCDCLVLAVGHSARDTFAMLKDVLPMEQKPFAVGLRIEHSQELINIHEFGDGKYKNYMPASYKLTCKTSNGRGVYSFCMCPGGYVVNASSEEGRLAVNGMSYEKRDSANANSALIVTVGTEDFGSEEVLAGIHFQQKLEEKAYALANGKIPVQLYGDFKKERSTTEDELLKNSIQPCMKGAYAPANLASILPEAVKESLKESVEYFDKQIPGFANPAAIFSGIESRTSSPVKILRNDSLQSTAIEGVYPCGEGAGYAGGITSAAVDGLRIYEAIVSQIN